MMVSSHVQAVQASVMCNRIQEGLDHPSDPVLLFHGIGVAFGWLKGILKVLLRGHLVAVLVIQSQREITDDPKKRREIFLNFGGVRV